MTIQELSHRANVTPRTVRYYVEEGILPPPERGRPSEYTDEHLRVLDLVRRLKEQYLPLEEIREMLQHLSPEQLEVYLSRTAPDQDRSETPVDSAADYVARVLSRGPARERLKQQAYPAQIPQSPQAPPGYRHPASPASPASPAPYPATYGGDQPAPVRATPSIYPGVPPAQPSSNPASWPHQPTETWLRTSLAPGVELHYIAGSEPVRQGAVERIIEAARRILAGSGATAHTDLDPHMEEHHK